MGLLEYIIGFVFICMWICPPCRSDVCAPMGDQAFNWPHDTSIKWNTVNWYYTADNGGNLTNIMYSLDELAPVVLSTQFMGRIGRITDSDLEMYLNDTTRNDTGTFSVRGVAASNTYLNSTHLNVTDANVERDITANAKLHIEGEPHNISELYIGKGETEFLFNVSATCMHPDIKIHYGALYTECLGQFHCNKTFSGGENITVVVKSNDQHVWFPESGMYSVGSFSYDEMLEKIINHTKTTIGGISEDISSTNGVSQSYPFDITFDVRELDDDITTPAMSIQLGDKLLKSGNTYILTTTITGAGTVTMHLVVNGVQPEDFIYPPTNWPGIISLVEDESGLEGWIIALIVIFCCLAVACVAGGTVYGYKKGACSDENPGNKHTKDADKRMKAAGQNNKDKGDTSIDKNKGDTTTRTNQNAMY